MKIEAWKHHELKVLINRVLLIFTILIAISCNQQSKDKAETSNPFDSRQIYALSLQGKVAEVINIFDSVPENKLSDENLDLKKKYYARFKGPGNTTRVEVKDSIIAPITGTFNSYWHKVLLDNDIIEEAELELRKKLADFLYKEHYLDTALASDVPDTHLTANLTRFLNDKGYHANVLGRTIPFIDAFIWAKETVKVYDLKLPETETQVRVIFMEDFASSGWAHYATFGKYYASGWATQDALYCVKDAYDLESEKFHVSYLVHEAQHFEDYKSFPELRQADLEYRAKLAELATAREIIYELIETFITRADNNMDYPHPYAQYCVIRDISRKIFDQEFVSDTEKWKKVDYPTLNSVSVELIKQHTRSLKGISYLTSCLASKDVATQ